MAPNLAYKTEAQFIPETRVIFTEAAPLTVNNGAGEILIYTCPPGKKALLFPKGMAQTFYTVTEGAPSNLTFRAAGVSMAQNGSPTPGGNSTLNFPPTLILAGETITVTNTQAGGLCSIAFNFLIKELPA